MRENSFSDTQPTEQSNPLKYPGNSALLAHLRALNNWMPAQGQRRPCLALPVTPLAAGSPSVLQKIGASVGAKGTGAHQRG